MRNQQAARYARWAALAAAAISLMVVGVYVQRAIRQARVRRAEPPAISPAVEQQASRFSFRRVEKGRTIFEVHASREVRLKTHSAVLQDVRISIYGYKGDRNDTIETHECDYDPISGAIRCAGKVRIELRPAQPLAASAPRSAGLTSLLFTADTSNLLFNARTGDASTPAPVEIAFARGRGSGTGVEYSTRAAVLRVRQDVRVELQPSPHTGGAPVFAQGTSLTVRREQRTISVGGPARIRAGDRVLDAPELSVWFDAGFHARRIVAGRAAKGGQALRLAGSERPELSVSAASPAAGAQTANLSADTFTVFLSPQGCVERATAAGGVRASRRGPKERSTLSAQRLEVLMLPGGNYAKEMTLSGAVSARVQRNGSWESLQSDELQLAFAPPDEPMRRKRNARTADPKAGSPLSGAAPQRIETAESLAPATLEADRGGERTRIHANRLAVLLAESGAAEKLLGHSGVEVERDRPGKPQDTNSAQELAISLDKSGQVIAAEETGDVQVREGDREADAKHLLFSQAENTAVLDGAPVLSDAQSRTTVGDRVTITNFAAPVGLGENKKAAPVAASDAQISATGGVISTYFPRARPGRSMSPVQLGAGSAHVFADSLQGSAASGHVIYSGHARIWQGDFVLDADRIELWREQQKLEAAGDVVAVFPQMPGWLPGLPRQAHKPPAAGSPSRNAATPGSLAPAVWRIRAALLDYWAAPQHVALDGGVSASSVNGSIRAQKLDVFLAPASASPGARPGQQLSRLIAQGSVLIRQAGGRASAERAEYTAADQKFVLSGGAPELADATGNTLSGDSLTFFLADDTILIASRKGSRTLTRHRVEK